DVSVGHLHRRRLSLPCVADGGMSVRRRARLIAPVDLRLFLLGPLLDGGVGLLQPLAYFFGILILGVAARLLGGVAPALEVLPHGSHRHVDAVLLGDQFRYRLAGPQRRSDPQAFRVLVVEQLLDVGGLLVVESSTRTWGASRAVMGKGVDATLGISAPPSGDGLPGHAKEVC